MKKIIAMLLAAMIVLPTIALAIPKPVSTYDNPKGKVNGPAGKSGVVRLYLVEKDPTDWTIVENGAWGKLKFNTKNDKFVFNGHKLNPDTEYSLIYYPDPWPGVGCKVLGSSTANEDGNVHIAGMFDFDSIPIAGDTNSGTKIWLVLKNDQNCPTGMTGWNPTEYLFEYNLI